MFYIHSLMNIPYDAFVNVVIHIYFISCMGVFLALKFFVTRETNIN
jgi:hypothetical protein